MADNFNVLTNQPVVIDNGSGVLKAGFAGDQVPKCVIRSCVGRPKHVRVMAASLNGDYFVGQKVEDYRGIMKISYAMEHGIVNDWADMERLWKFIYSKEQLQIAPEEHPVLLTEPPLNPYKNRQRVAEIFFESFSTPALHFCTQATLGLYATGRTTGLVADCGDGVTHSVPIFEGFALTHSIVRTDVAGRDVTKFLKHLLRREGHYFNSSAEFEVLRSIKEKACFVSQNITQDEKGDLEKTSYLLPDGNTIELGNSRFRAPELLFHPDLFGLEFEGIHEALHYSIQKSDMDLRTVLSSNIVLSGGSTMFRGFGERLLSELKKLIPKDVKLRISAPADRLYSTWMGGSILASLESFKKMWISKREYEEEGFRVILRKTF